MKWEIPWWWVRAAWAKSCLTKWSELHIKCAVHHRLSYSNDAESQKSSQRKISGWDGRKDRFLRLRSLAENFLLQKFIEATSDKHSDQPLSAIHISWERLLPKAFTFETKTLSSSNLPLQENYQHPSLPIICTDQRFHVNCIMPSQVPLPKTFSLKLSKRMISSWN